MRDQFVRFFSEVRLQEGGGLVSGLVWLGGCLVL